MWADSAIDGRLEWREWQPDEGATKRQAVQIVADSVQFLAGARRDDAEPGEAVAAGSDS